MKLEERPHGSMKLKRPVMPLDVKKKLDKEGKWLARSERR
jgi:hypothetical protein